MMMLMMMMMMMIIIIIIMDSVNRRSFSSLFNFQSNKSREKIFKLFVLLIKIMPNCLG